MSDDKRSNKSKIPTFYGRDHPEEGDTTFSEWLSKVVAAARAADVHKEIQAVVKDPKTKPTLSDAQKKSVKDRDLYSLTHSSFAEDALLNVESDETNLDDIFTLVAAACKSYLSKSLGARITLIEKFLGNKWDEDGGEKFLTFVAKKKKLFNRELGGSISNDEFMIAGILAGTPPGYSDLVSSVVAMGGKLDQVVTAIQEKSSGGKSESNADVHNTNTNTRNNNRNNRKKEKNNNNNDQNGNQPSQNAIKTAIVELARSGGLNQVLKQHPPKRNNNNNGGKNSRNRNGGGGGKNTGGNWQGGSGQGGGWSGGWGQGGYGNPWGGKGAGKGKGNCKRCGQPGHNSVNCMAVLGNQGQAHVIQAGPPAQTAQTIPAGYKIVRG